MALQIILSFLLLWIFLTLMIGDKIIYLLPFIVCGIVRNNLDMRFILSCLVYLWIVSILDLFLPQLDSFPNPQPTYLNSTIIDPHVLDSLPKPPPHTQMPQSSIPMFFLIAQHLHHHFHHLHCRGLYLSTRYGVLSVHLSITPVRLGKTCIMLWSILKKL